jgi:putative oxidoreductase
VRRLFSTFARGLPGIGLLLMRLVAGFALIAESLARLRVEPRVEPVLLPGLAILAALLLIAGLWTPVIGSLVAVIGVTAALFQRGDPLVDVLVGSIGAALALIGPGAWSLDAYLFGWKRVDVPDRSKDLKRGGDSSD